MRFRWFLPACNIAIDVVLFGILVHDVDDLPPVSRDAAEDGSEAAREGLDVLPFVPGGEDRRDHHEGRLATTTT